MSKSNDKLKNDHRSQHIKHLFPLLFLSSAGTALHSIWPGGLLLLSPLPPLILITIGQVFSRSLSCSLMLSACPFVAASFLSPSQFLCFSAFSSFLILVFFNIPMCPSLYASLLNNFKHKLSSLSITMVTNVLILSKSERTTTFSFKNIIKYVLQSVPCSGSSFTVVLIAVLSPLLESYPGVTEKSA